MITEIAEIEVKPGTEEKFIAGVESCKPIFLVPPASAAWNSTTPSNTRKTSYSKSNGIPWRTTWEQFQKSADFALFAVGVGEYLAGKPKLQHTNTVVAI